MYLQYASTCTTLLSIYLISSQITFYCRLLDCLLDTTILIFHFISLLSSSESESE